MKLVKTLLILAALGLGAIGVLAVLDILKPEEAIHYGEKTFGVLVVLGLISGVILLVMGKT